MARRKGKLPFYPMAVLSLLGVGGYLGCDPNSAIVSNAPNSTASLNPQYTEFIPPRTESRILIGSFNLERLGPNKAGDPWVMDRFATIVRQFDVLAVQEITDKDQTALPKLVDWVNQDGSQYAFTVSPRIGRTSYLEQYAFIYDQRRIQTGQEFSYVVNDSGDYLHREPFVGRFQTTSTQQPFRFTLMNIHTDPDEIAEELDVLAHVYREVRKFEYPEDDVILLGDLNQQPGSLQQLEQIPYVSSLVVNMPTNTVRNKTLDNILIDRQNTLEFTGRAGTIDLQSVFEISTEEAGRISDHLPIWAEFSVVEQAGRGGNVAAGESPVAR